MEVPKPDPKRSRRPIPALDPPQLAAIKPRRLSERLKTAIQLAGGEVLPNVPKKWENLYWADNPSSAPAVVPNFDVVVLPRQKALKLTCADEAYYDAVDQYLRIDESCVIATRTRKGLEIIGVYVTDDSSLDEVAELREPALAAARAHLRPRDSFASTGRSFDRKESNSTIVKEMQGTIWNDGLQSYMTLCPKFQGRLFVDYYRRRSDMTDQAASDFARIFVAMYGLEKAVVPAVANFRLKLVDAVGFPEAIPGVPRELLPATCVGISHDFATKTHNDSCVKGMCETIYWPNRDLSATFAITTVRVCLDIGRRPTLLFMKGNEMHGTAPSREPNGSVGCVLISKSRELIGKQHYCQGSDRDLATRAIMPA